MSPHETLDWLARPKFLALMYAATYFLGALLAVFDSGAKAMSSAMWWLRNAVYASILFPVILVGWWVGSVPAVRVTWQVALVFLGAAVVCALLNRCLEHFWPPLESGKKGEGELS